MKIQRPKNLQIPCNKTKLPDPKDKVTDAYLHRPSSVQSRISLHEFQRALERTCRPPKKNARRPFRIGIAVSGGVDSMCLAALAVELQEQPSIGYQFHAFVVDHKARPTSSQEASTVKSWLEKKGMPTSVLEVKWALEQGQPSDLTDFETQARKHRYRALGKECRRHGITELLLGHHSDDQAETVMSRILGGSAGSGLCAMAPTAPIPECFGMIGAHNIPKTNYKRSKVLSAARGVTIHRPLLQFTKIWLENTCKQLEFDWIEDATNSDPTLTQRNAVRYMWSQPVPAALSPNSIISLRRVLAEKSLAVRNAAEDVLKRIDFVALDLRSGVMKIAIPVEPILKNRQEKGIVDQSDLAEAMLQVAQCVTGNETVTQKQGMSIAQKVFSNPPTQPTFTLASTLWQAEESFSPDSICWTISREPYSRKPPLAPYIWINPDAASSDQWQGHPQTSRYGTWQLFDGRFWMRLWSTSFESLTVRPLKQTDRAVIYEKLGARSRQKLEGRLRSAAPGSQIRQTLPAIATSTDDQILALPTLNFSFLGEKSYNLDWEVQYKYTSVYDPEFGQERGKVVAFTHADHPTFLLRPLVSASD